MSIIGHLVRSENRNKRCGGGGRWVHTHPQSAQNIARPTPTPYLVPYWLSEPTALGINDPWSHQGHESCFFSSRWIGLRSRKPDFNRENIAKPNSHPHTWFHVGFLDPQLSGSVINIAAEATNRVFLARGLV